ncbi:hypothetical protein BGZ57DRAFT_988038 [Hyaloscypha finlandica]|nr:hypothetical protein BGZ57DRAFT_988038 [Hyaloscypha finlandica]
MERGKQGFFHRLRRGKFIAEVAGKLPLTAPASRAESSRTSTSSRSARDNAGSPSSSQASTVGKVADGELEEGQLSVSSLVKTPRYMQASGSSATPLLDGIRGLIHDLTTIEFNFGGLPIRLRLGLLWFLLLVIGGILIIRSQVLQTGGGQTPVGPPAPSETPVVVPIGFPVSTNGTEAAASFSESVVPTCTLDYVFNVTSGFCDPNEAAKLAFNATDLQADHTLPSCPSGRIYDQSSKSCAILLSGGAFINSSTGGLKAVQTLMLEADLYSNIQRTLPAWIFLAVLLVLHWISIINTCMIACYCLYDCWNFLLFSVLVVFVRRNPAETVLFLWQIPSVAYITARSYVQQSGSAHAAGETAVRTMNCDGHVLESSWRSPFRTLARWTVRGTVKITRFFLFLAFTIITRGGSTNRVPHTGGHFISSLSGHLQREELSTTLDARSQDSARSSIEPEFPVTERMDQWIQTVPLTQLAGNFASTERLNFDSSIDIESGR